MWGGWRLSSNVAIDESSHQHLRHRRPVQKWRKQQTRVPMGAQQMEHARKSCLCLSLHKRLVKTRKKNAGRIAVSLVNLPKGSIASIRLRSGLLVPYPRSLVEKSRPVKSGSGTTAGNELSHDEHIA
jgi:hypothetical protein